MLSLFQWYCCCTHSKRPSLPKQSRSVGSKDKAYFLKNVLNANRHLKVSIQTNRISSVIFVVKEKPPPLLYFYHLYE